MDINLLTEPMLGHWRLPSGAWQCEFQYGSRLIYVEHRDGEAPHGQLMAAQRDIAAVWADLPLALSFAEAQCDPSMVELLALCQTHRPGQSPLFVYSIHFELDCPYPSYAISKNPDFNWAQRLNYDDEWGQALSVCLEDHEPKDDFWLYVRRSATQQFELQTQR